MGMREFIPVLAVAIAAGFLGFSVGIQQLPYQITNTTVYFDDATVKFYADNSSSEIGADLRKTPGLAGFATPDGLIGIIANNITLQQAYNVCVHEFCHIDIDFMMRKKTYVLTQPMGEKFCGWYGETAYDQRCAALVVWIYNETHG